MKIEKREHQLWKEWNEIKGEVPKLRQIVDRWQYIYSTEKGEISLVKLLDYFEDGQDFWEIYCLKWDLFEDVERFKTKKEAEKRIKELLEVDV